MTKSDLKNIEMTAKFSNFEVLNEDFTRCRCSVFYTGRNRNYSDITESALDKFIARKGYANIPVVAHLMKDDDGNFYVGSHDRKIIISNEGIDFIDETVPYGVIPEDCNPSKDIIIEKSGIQRKYFSVDIILWTYRYPIMEASYNNEIYFNQSMEIAFDSFEIDDDGYAVVHDFHMSALCLLNKRDSSGTDGNNKNQEPCFESSQVRKFSIDESKFKQNFELMLEKLKQYESAGANSTVQNNAINNNKRKGESKMDFAKITEALSAQKFKNSNGEEVLKYKLLNATDSKVFALDMEDYKPYGFDYAITKNGEAEAVAVIVFESKAEMSLSATDKIVDDGFNEFSIKNEIDTVKEAYSKENVEKKVQEVTASVSAAFQKEYDNLKNAYDSLVEAHKIAQGKVDAYEAKENAERIEAHKNEINSLVDSYAEKLGKYSAFLVYKANIEQKYSMTTEQVEQDLIIMAGRYLTSKENAVNKKYSYNPTEAGVGAKNNGVIENKYGHLLDKYVK